MDRDVAEQERKLAELNSQFEKLKMLLDQKGFARTQRQNTATTFETITSNTSTVRFRCKRESQNVLEYIHGGKEGALYGAWDFLQSNAKEMMDSLIASYKRGKYLDVVSQALKEHSKSDESLTVDFGSSEYYSEKLPEIDCKQAVAFKYKNFLSRRKFDLLRKTQSTAFDADQEV